MQDLMARADKAARTLKDRGETIAVAESSTGSLIAAALLALPGASGYFLGGAVVYTQVARSALLGLPDLATLAMRLDGAIRTAVGANRAATLLGDLGVSGERSNGPIRRGTGRACDHA